MLKTPAQTVAGGAPKRGDATRHRIIEAVFATLAREGFAGVTARAVARTGGFNQALIYYHYGSVENSMFAALKRFSEDRLERYESVLDGVDSVSRLLASMAELYERDVAAGQLAAVQEIVAGCSSSPELGGRVVDLLEPWVGLAERIVRRLVEGTAFEALVPVPETAYALVALYFGVETLAHLDAERGRIRRLFEAGSRVAPALDAVLRAS
jgi:AcrR family transcriptional regulator